MALTIALEMPGGIEVVISVLVVVASILVIWKFFPRNTPKKNKPIVCDVSSTQPHNLSSSN
jgi:hypothetical protein